MFIYCTETNMKLLIFRIYSKEGVIEDLTLNINNRMLNIFLHSGS